MDEKNKGEVVRDLVISSRVRIARNLDQYFFPSKMNYEQAKAVVDIIKNIVLKSKDDVLKDIIFIDIEKLNNTERQSMVERHLISPDLAQTTQKSAVLLSKDEKISVMINEEDHLRIQCLNQGLSIDKAWETCGKIDSIISKNTEYAFDKKLGYLTSCPTNIGTAVRASTMLHLPALIMTGHIKGVLEACTKFGIAVRGIYGENSEPNGNILQISNQVSLGQTEEEIIGNINSVTVQILEQEKVLRNELYKQNKYKLEDKIYRAVGVLSNSRIITSEESLKLISDIRLGVEIGLIKNISLKVLNEIMVSIQPASLQAFFKRPLNWEERDVKRAEYIREKLKCFV